MAADTVSGDVDVVKIRRQPAGRRVAIITIVAAGDVRRVLASCGNTVMA